MPYCMSLMENIFMFVAICVCIGSYSILIGHSKLLIGLNVSV